MLTRDDCWENAYRMMMVAYDRLGNQVQVQRTYQWCLEWLRGELDVEPAGATAELYEALMTKG
jgi:DNA-binding SARP family transcriptional activator